MDGTTMADEVFQNWLCGYSQIQYYNISSRFSQEYASHLESVDLSSKMKKEVLAPVSCRRGVAFSAKAGSWNKGAGVTFYSQVIGGPQYRCRPFGL